MITGTCGGGNFFLGTGAYKASPRAAPPGDSIPSASGATDIPASACREQRRRHRDTETPTATGPHAQACEEMRVRVNFASAVFELGDEWSITVRGNHVYDRLSGPEHRLDISMHARGKVAAVGRPHSAGIARNLAG